jgi:hypothetical protein
MFFKYLPGETYRSNIEKYEDGYLIVIENGIHSYTPDVILNKGMTHVWDDKRRKVLRIHPPGSNQYLDSVAMSWNLVKLLCVIPFGATYYVNKDGEYVSDAIKVLSAEKL